MIKLEHCEVMGWEHVIRGMRNPKNSWSLSDSGLGCDDEGCLCRDCEHSENRFPGDCSAYFAIGPKDHKLMMNLRNAGTDHRKFMRMITVYVDITAPLYWWKEFDTYKIGTTANSCSTMHKIHERDLTLEDFSCEKLMDNCGLEIEFTNEGGHTDLALCGFDDILRITIDAINFARRQFLETGEKVWWDQMIQLLPTSYNQKRTVMLNYEVLANMYKSRKNHKLDEWRELCKWIESLPYSELITGEVNENESN